jgi:hypothetical protein
MDEIHKDDGVISAASLPEKFQITEPFSPEYLMTIPKDVLVKFIGMARDEYKKLQVKHSSLLSDFNKLRDSL